MGVLKVWNGSAWEEVVGGVGGLPLDISVAGTFGLAGDLNVASMAGTENDWAPSGIASASVIRATPSTTTNLTGIAGGVDGRVLVLINKGVSGEVIVLKNDDAGSVAANRFLLPIEPSSLTPPDFYIRNGVGVPLWYDATSSRWRVLATPSPAVNLSFVPALTAATTNPTLGGATPTGQYRVDGMRVSGRGRIAFGATSPTAGSGNYRVSLPLTASGFYNANEVMGYGHLRDASASASRAVILRYLTGTTCELVNTADGVTVTNAAPWTWAASDIISYTFDYERLMASP